MKIILRLYIILLLLNTSCSFGDGMSSSQKKYLENLQPKKLTDKEIGFKNKLSLEGYFNIEIINPRIGIVNYGNSEYYIYLNCPFDYVPEKSDTLNKITKKIVNDLFTNVIEDSILYDINIISVHLNLKHHRTKKSIEYYDRYHISDLEKFNNLKVVKSKEGKLERKTYF